jgi:hypothetical protein
MTRSLECGPIVSFLTIVALRHLSSFKFINHLSCSLRNVITVIPSFSIQPPCPSSMILYPRSTIGFAEMRSSTSRSSGRTSVEISGVIWAAESTMVSSPFPNITVVLVDSEDKGSFRLVAVLSRIIFASAPQSNLASVGSCPISHFPFFRYSFLAAM